MSYVRIWVHVVFATKNRAPFLKQEKRDILCQHIMANCQQKGIFLQAITGSIEHIHCLISLSKKQNIAEVVQLIKGESAYWLNSNTILSENMAWQDDYFAVSVSESQVEAVVHYIQNQEQHHAKKSYAQEVEEFLKKYGFQKAND